LPYPKLNLTIQNVLTRGHVERNIRHSCQARPRVENKLGLVHSHIRPKYFRHATPELNPTSLSGDTPPNPNIWLQFTCTVHTAQTCWLWPPAPYRRHTHLILLITVDLQRRLPSRSRDTVPNPNIGFHFTCTLLSKKTNVLLAAQLASLATLLATASCGAERTNVLGFAVVRVEARGCSAFPRLLHCYSW